MDNFRGPGKVLSFAAPYDRLSGQGALLGALFGVAMIDVLSGVTADFLMEGEFTGLAKLSTDVWAVGDRLYWDDSNKRLDLDSTVGTFVAVATAVTANPSTTGQCVLVKPSELAEGAQAYLAALTMGTDITAATANGSLEDSSAVNPTKVQFDNNMKEIGTRLNAITAALITAKILKAS